MADQINTTTSTPANNSGGNGIAFVVGILVVVVAIMGYFFFANGSVPGDGDTVNITVEGAPAVADAIEGAAETATGN